MKACTETTKDDNIKNEPFFRTNTAMNFLFDDQHPSVELLTAFVVIVTTSGS
jgi:hypothetical protein